jgi:hypothetical protein
MQTRTEAFIDATTGRWYGVIRLYMDDGHVETLYKSEGHRSREEAETSTTRMMQEAVAKVMSEMK